MEQIFKPHDTCTSYLHAFHMYRRQNKKKYRHSRQKPYEDTRIMIIVFDQGVRSYATHALVDIRGFLCR